MKTIKIFLGLVLLILLAEGLSLLILAGWAGFLPAFLWAGMTALYGVLLMRRFSGPALERLRRGVSRETLAGPGVEAMTAWLAGLLLLSPGLLSDGISAYLLFKIHNGSQELGGGANPAGPVVIDADYEDVTGEDITRPRRTRSDE